MSTERRKRWRIATCLAPQATLFGPGSDHDLGQALRGAAVEVVEVAVVALLALRAVQVAITAAGALGAGALQPP